MLLFQDKGNQLNKTQINKAKGKRQRLKNREKYNLKKIIPEKDYFQNSN